MESTKRPTIMHPELPEIELPGALSEQTSEAYKKTLGADSEHAEPVIREAAQTQAEAARAWAGFNKLRKNRDPKKTPAQHLADLGVASERLQKSVFGKADGAKKRIKERRAKLENEISDRIMKHSEDAGEIRQTLREMPEEKRHAAVMEAIKDGDTGVLHAVFSGRPVTTGITKEQLQSLRRYAEKQLAGDLHEKKQMLSKAENLIFEVIHNTIELSGKAIGDPESRKKFLEQAQAADEAVMQFNASLK